MGSVGRDARWGVLVWARRLRHHACLPFVQSTTSNHIHFIKPFNTKASTVRHPHLRGEGDV